MNRPASAINHQLIQQAKDYGKEWGLLFHEFSYWLIDRCQQLGIKKIFFFTREGAFFIELVKLLKDKFNVDNIELHLLAVSRLATFLASVDIDSENAFQRLWNIYPNQSPKAFFVSLGIKHPRLEQLYTRHYNGHFDVVINNISKHSGFKNFLKTQQVKTIISNAIACKKILLKKYLEQNAFLDDDRVAVVDIGWRGSIQDNLSLIFPEKKLHGLYFGLHRFKEKFLPENNVKEGFLFNANSKKYGVFSSLMRFVLPLEFLCTPAEGSVIGYIDKNDKLEAKIKFSKTEVMLIKDIIIPFQQSVLDSMNSYQPNIHCNLKACRKIAKELIWNPKEFQLFFYRNNQFNEEFGQGIASQYYAKKELKKVTTYSLEGIFSVINKLKKSSWISAYLHDTLPKPLHRMLPILYLLYCLVTFDSYLLRWK